jgi:hypothetical protein
MAWSLKAAMASEQAATVSIGKVGSDEPALMIPCLPMMPMMWGISVSVQE